MLNIITLNLKASILAIILLYSQLHAYFGHVYFGHVIACFTVIEFMNCKFLYQWELFHKLICYRKLSVSVLNSDRESSSLDFAIAVGVVLSIMILEHWGVVFTTACNIKVSCQIHVHLKVIGIGPQLCIFVRYFLTPILIERTAVRLQPNIVILAWRCCVCTFSWYMCIWCTCIVHFY